MKKLTLSSLALAVAMGVSLPAAATTPDPSFPAVWIPSNSGTPQDGIGAQLSFIDAPVNDPKTFRTGKIGYFAFYTNNENGEPLWLATNFLPVPGMNTYEVPLVVSTGTDVAGSSAPAAATAGSATLVFEDCNTIKLTGQGEGDYASLGSFDITFHAQSAVAGNIGNSACPYVEPVPTTMEATTPICEAGGGTALQPGVCQVAEGTYTQDMTWANNVLWLTNGKVKIGDTSTENTLTIAAGTTVAANADSVLVIQRNANIHAVGSRLSPIVITSVKDVDPGSTPVAGEVAGVYIAGNATINNCSAGDPNATTENGACVALDEALAEITYGGNNDQDSSGIIKYMQIRYSGLEILPDKEIQGLTLLGVGARTVLDYIQVHRSTDDGVENFGGAAQLRHVVVTGEEDDGFDWGFGYHGKAQYVLVYQYEGLGNHGIEADSNEDNYDATPRAFPKLANFTIIGPGNNGEGVRFRRGTAVNAHGFVITGMPKECVNLDDAATFNNIADGNLVMTNSLVYNCAGGNFDDNAEDPGTVSSWYTSQPGNVADQDPMLNGYLPRAGSPALNVDESDAAQPIDPWLDPVRFKGAFAGENDDWTRGWTIGLPVIER